MGWDWGNAGAGAASGAATGSIFGAPGAAIGGAAGGIFGGLTGGGDPAEAARKHYENINRIGQKYYNPYIEGGQRAGGLLEGEYGRNINDPTSLIDKIMEKYQMSKGAQYQQDKLGKGIAATAAAGGISGTPEHQTQYGEMANNIMSQDMQQFLQNALGIYGGGMHGEENFYNKGYDASKELADMLGGSEASQATMGYNGSQQKTANSQALMAAISKALSQRNGNNDSGGNAVAGLPTPWG